MTAMTHEHSATLPAPVARVFAALTEPAQLERWFAEHVDVEARRGGKFAFWGKHTYSTHSRAAATQRLVEFDAPGRIAFNWTVDGKDSMVTLTLTPDAKPEGEQTRIAVRQEFDEAPDGPRVKYLIDDLWRLAFGNLMAYLMAGADGVVFVDFTDPSPSVTASVLIDAPRERVFQALLDPAIMNQWISSKAEVEPRAGGRYVYGWEYKNEDRDVLGGPTHIIELVENEKLVTDWPDWRGLPDRPSTTVTWLLETIGKQTRVTIVHGVFERAADISDYGAGWAWFLSQLKATTEKPAAA
jgi:uncharacterized protein YndB with AHSA1/START domain